MNPNALTQQADAPITERPSPTTAPQRVPLHPVAAVPTKRAPEPLPAYGSNAQQALGRLNWLHAHYGNLSGWTPRMVEQVIQQTCRMQAALVDRAHRANMRRMRAAFGWAWSGQPIIHWTKEKGGDLHHVVLPPGSKPEGASFGSGQCVVVSAGNVNARLSGLSCILTSGLIGEPLFADKQIVYAFAKATSGRHYQLRYPGEVLWLEGSNIKRHGCVERIVFDDVVSVNGGAIVPLMVRLSPSTVCREINLNTFKADLVKSEPGVALTSLLNRPLPPADVVDIVDGRPMSELPELLRYTAGPLRAGYEMERAESIDRRSSAYMATVALRLFAKDAKFS